MNSDDDSNQNCECSHNEWIRAWQEKERRRQQLFASVQANVLTWTVIGGLGYVILLLIDGLKQHVKIP